MPERRRPAGRASAVVKRSVLIAGHATSVSLETAFWDALKSMATERDLSLTALVTEIDGGRTGENLSSAIRVSVLKRYRDSVAGPMASLDA
ncbi:ribbon-helix-helix domain-containing protein [Lichenihabitans sp. Uapishka_5]|uniref:ribbon-helix-helix domain-containing protein n=1 Tax=Lichenihabitans sp. Uapishka_5 TaxID=3037302 RepID=UPI0029E7FC7C|nr:ribbon-helix-helix domain-containing protein [Lichenihabitans sp. Uapishka_5]MDX7952571.1 ribbon-helix-helix domain-containing protein [Lichenihabitans sp. Uapishka_5]